MWSDIYVNYSKYFVHINDSFHLLMCSLSYLFYNFGFYRSKIICVSGILNQDIYQ